MMTDPAKTVALLERLQSLGFNDQAFAILHHFGVPATIASHVQYCQNKITEFRAGSTNILVQKRLEIVLGAYTGGSFATSSPQIFKPLAQAAVIEVPHHRQ